MKIITIENIPGKDYEVVGMVQGSMVQSKHIGKDVAAGFKTLVGGELKGYTEMLQEARQIAIDRMIAMAEEMGADTIIGVKFSTSAIVQGAAEVTAYGTAVKIK